MLSVDGESRIGFLTSSNPGPGVLFYSFLLIMVRLMSEIYDWSEIRKYLATEFMGWTLCRDGKGHSWYGEGEVPFEDCIMGTGSWEPNLNFNQSELLIKKCKDTQTENGETEWGKCELKYNYDEERWRCLFIRSSIYGGRSEKAFHERPEKAVCLAVLMCCDVNLDRFKKE